MPSERFADALNDQIGRELAAAHQYLAIGVHYAGATFPRLAAFFQAQAAEERGHAMRMIDYLLDQSVPVRLDQIAAPRTDFADHVEPIRVALEQERAVTVAISGLFEIARETRDYTSEQFVQWFLEEQVEEESTMGDLLTVAERTREIPMLLEDYLVRELAGADGGTEDGGRGHGLHG